ncbi:hypothetical protein BU26DRAFT_438662 [Trematosphaeria pertusa]|uniref:SnoaL-like domain-containing protein n=1 Tax=Trematosphaeria pertusa TaxID=390896 RepID=A0A6A6HVV9_9PLEO|nr:uncharacterized protein BU26DRAFT_438662 [Trematosphaeria pertusa]KAF2242315.1 hypothetical protein BU26DRAFT_438662 [Trematosphaeria pertusa]
MADPVTLTALSPRKAVADALHRCMLGIDSNNRALFESSCLKNESMTVVAGPMTFEGWPAISDFFFRLFDLVTTHITSNIRVELKDGADTASMSAHVLAYHVRPDDAFTPEDTSYTGACLYWIDLVKDCGDGLWRIKKWEIKILWSTGDRAVLHG